MCFLLFYFKTGAGAPPPYPVKRARGEPPGGTPTPVPAIPPPQQPAPHLTPQQLQTLQCLQQNAHNLTTPQQVME